METLHTTFKMSVGIQQGRGIGHKPWLIMYCINFSYKALVVMLDMEIFSLVLMRLGIIRPSGGSMANSSKNYYSFTAFLRSLPVNCLCLLGQQKFFPRYNCKAIVDIILLIGRFCSVSGMSWCSDMFACKMEISLLRIGAVTRRTLYCGETVNSCYRSTALCWERCMYLPN